MAEHTPTESTSEPAILASEEGSDADNLEHAGPGPSTAQSRTTAHLKTLGKGRACVKCRTRKMRCDGKRPTCASCLRQKRECIYEPERTRTQKLLDKITVLEKRLTELRLVGRPRGSISHQDPLSDDTPSLVSEGGAPSIVSPLPDSPLDPWLHNHLAFEDVDWSGEWWLHDSPSRPIQKYLIDTCLIQCRPRFYFHAGRFWNSMSEAYDGVRPLPGLLNAMYLLGCNTSNQPSLTEHEEYYLARTRRMQADSLSDPSVPLLQWMQASSLVATYLLRRGRLLEARQELSGTIQLVMGCGLHKIKSSVWQAPDPTIQQHVSSDSMLSPPKDNVELGERILLFWMVWYSDHVCALLSGLPPSNTLESETETVWPSQVEEYEQVGISNLTLLEIC
ncbi:hypothetical protein FRB94_009412 [Tulasnella sp. JGI-2019a]|nr:hypothetical protein FRB94_009412 [Tulasnella sp. JGI-2019a]KAG9038433.1 hypothetical protein FRB95_001290 [Tulasnella sp. JGI-2019a]